MKPTLIDCPRCHGYGRVAIEEHHQIVLNMIRGGLETSEQVLNELAARGKPISAANMGNRMLWLLRNGLVTRIKQNATTGGIEYVYMVTPNGKLQGE